MDQTGSGSSPVSNLVRFRHLQTELTFSDLLLIVRRRKWVPVVTVIVCLVIAVIIILSTPRRFSAVTTIEVNKDGGGLSLGLEDLSGIASGLGGSADLAINLQTEQEILLNDNTAIGVIERLDLLHSPDFAKALTKAHLAVSNNGSKEIETNAFIRHIVLAKFKQGLKVTTIKGSRLLQIQYISTDPELASQVANTVVDVYLNNKTKERYDASNRTSVWLGNQLQDLKNRVESSQRAVASFQREHNLLGVNMASKSDHAGEMADANNTAFERLQDLNRQLTTSEVQRIAKEAVYRLTLSHDSDLVLQAGTTQLGLAGGDSALAQSNLALLQSLRQQQSELRINLAAVVDKYGPANPVRTEMQSQVLAIDEQISRELQRIAARAKGDFEIAKSAEDHLRAEVDSQESIVGKLNNSVAELAVLQQEAISSRTLYQDLYSKLEEADITASVRASNITVVDTARTSSDPFTPKSLQDIVAALALGLVFGFIGTFVVDYLDDAIITPADVENMADLPMMGLIPLFDLDRGAYGTTDPSAEADPRVAANRPWIVRKPNSNVSEAYRQIRTNLLLSQADRKLQVIAVTSPLSGDGKSTTTTNIAVSFAFQGSKVLLVDADLRRPTVHQQLNIERGKGLSNVLSGTATLDEVIRTVPYVNNLDVLTAGPSSPMPSELLGSSRFEALIETLRERYEYILLDAPPLLLVADPLLIATRSDGMIVVLRSRVTTRAVLRRMFSVLSSPGVPLLGFIMNAANIASADYYYYGVGTGYGYGYGSYYQSRSTEPPTEK